MTVVKPSLSADEHPLSLPRLLSLDLPVVVSSLLLAGVWLIGLPTLLLGYLPVGWGRIVFSGAEVVTILVVVLVISLLAGPLIVLRLLHFRSILRHGVLLHGQVIRRFVTFAEYRVEYVFQHHYQPFQQRNAIESLEKIDLCCQ